MSVTEKVLAAILSRLRVNVVGFSRRRPNLRRWAGRVW